MLAATLPARAQPCVLPAENELMPLDPPPEPFWALQERWVWKQTLAGEIADFNQLYCEWLDPNAGGEAWPSPAKPRQLSERFLLDVLAKKRFAEAVPPRGLRIIGAWFPTPIDFSGIEFEHQIWLLGSRFTGPVRLNGARLKGFVSFSGSTFEATLDMGSLEVGQGLFLDGRAVFKGNVNLRSAKLGKQLDASGSTFEAILDMDGLEAGQSLFLRSGAVFKEDVVLVTAKVGDNLETDGSTFEATLDMDSLEVDGSLYLRGGAVFKGDVILRGAKVGGDFDLSGATFHKTVEGSAVVIEGELRLGSLWLGRSLWEPEASLVLRNTKVGAVQDRIDELQDGTRQDAWPRHLQLDGFAYARLGGFGGEEASEMMDRPTSWYVGWLKRDESFSPQPYRQLAGVYREAGADAKANETLYALREREREEAWRRGEYGQWLGLSLLWAGVGYGIGTGYFRALLWAGLFTLVGTLVLWGSGTAARARGVGWCAWASFDEILPVIELDEKHTKFINEELAGWRRTYFYLHRIVAYVIGSFVIAGLAGLTQGT